MDNSNAKGHLKMKYFMIINMDFFIYLVPDAFSVLAEIFRCK